MNEIKDVQIFYKKLEQSGTYIYTEFNFDTVLKLNDLKQGWYLFENCIFNCSSLMILNISNDVKLEFRDCEFNCGVTIQNCSIEELTFKNTKRLKYLILNNGYGGVNEIGSFQFINDYILEEKPRLSTEFEFRNLTILRVFSFENIIHDFGSFVVSESKFGQINGLSSYFINSKISNVHFNKNEFNSFVLFVGTTFNYLVEAKKQYAKEFSIFYKCVFNKVNFNEISIIGLLCFDNCDFNETVWFEKIKFIDKSNLNIISSRFDKYVLFDNSSLFKLEILHTHFERKVSFNKLTVNNFKIHQVSFLESAYFDDLNMDKIEAIENWDRKTLRAIKRELINTHNQIDYLRFKAYELEAYKNEKGKSWKDDFILSLNSFSSKNGLDWIKALRFIFLTSFINYLFYLISYLISIKRVVPNGFPIFLEGFFVYYLKFINPLMFLKSPIEDAENYFFPLLFLLLGKILISYGIYQLIQAFRKFGKNGD